MMVSLMSAVPLVFVFVLFVFEDRASTPSCEVVNHNEDPRGQSLRNETSEDLKVMMVANLLLRGSDASYMDMFFRDPFMAKFFRKSFEVLKPDMLVVMGDLSAAGWQLTNKKWLSVLEQFQKIVGPFIGLPVHVIVGDRDVGGCGKLDPSSVRRIASNLPGLDSAGCSSFEISNSSFVSLNTMALQCGESNLRLMVEKVIERESSYVQSSFKGSAGALDGHIDVGKDFEQFRWRENVVQPGAGPVLLLHFPLHRKNNNCGGIKSLMEDNVNNENCEVIGASANDCPHVVPPNATEYIFQALRPRIVFSAHTQSLCNHIHKDGTREVTVPPMAWDLSDEPGFVVAGFGQGSAITISHCTLGRRSHVLMAYLSILVLLVSIALLEIRTQLCNC